MGFEPVVDGFQIVTLALMNRHDADFGRAVEIAQRHANGVKQPEDVGRHGRPPGERHLDAGQAELVAQRLQYQHFRERQRQSRAEGYRLAVEPRDMDLTADLNAPGIDRPTNWPGV